MKNKVNVKISNTLKSVKIQNDVGTQRIKDGLNKTVSGKKTCMKPTTNNDSLNVDGSTFPLHFVTLPSDFQMKGQKMKLFSRKAVTINDLYRSSSSDSSGTDRSAYSERLYEQSSSTRNLRYQTARSAYYPDKFHALKEQIQILHQVINSRGKRISSLNDVVNNLQEQRQQLENRST